MPRITPTATEPLAKRIAADVRKTLSGTGPDAPAGAGKWAAIYAGVQDLIDRQWSTPRIVAWLIAAKHLTPEEAPAALWALQRRRRTAKKSSPANQPHTPETHDHDQPITPNARSSRATPSPARRAAASLTLAASAVTQ